LAAELQSLVIGSGQRVAVLSPTTSALLEAHLAVPLAGGVLCALNTRLTVEEIRYIIGHCGASVLIYDADFDAFVERLAPAIHCIRVSRGPSPGAPLAPSIGASGDSLLTMPASRTVHDFESWLAGADVAGLIDFRPAEDTTISLNYTSGTTGQPKAVMYTYRGAYLNALAEIFHSDLRPESAYLWTLPMFHCNGWCFPWTLSVVAGTHVCLRQVRARAMYDAIAEHKVTHLCGAPIVMATLLNAAAEEKKPLPHVVEFFTAAAPPPD